MALSPGKLRHVITIQALTHKQDSFGAVKKEWLDVDKNVPAAIEYLSVREFLNSQAMQSKVSARITIRHRPSLRADMRILHRGKIYNIVGILPDLVSGLEYITIPVTEGTNEG